MTINLREPAAELCRRLGIDETYVAHIDLYPDKAIVTLFKGRDGHCQGAKYVNRDTGQAAMEVHSFKVRT